MNSFFSMFRGEWRASIFLLLFIFSLLLCSFIPWKKTKFVNDAQICAEIKAFYAEQNYLDSLHRKDYQTKSSKSSIVDTEKNFSQDTLRPLKKQILYEIVKLNINTCDSFAIFNVPQFGAKRARKLLEYRTRLGGFYSFDQVREIYILQNMEDEFLQKFFYIDSSDIKPIMVNHATYKDLATHPYLDGYLAKIILNHREYNGKIKNIDEFQKITHAYKELIDKLEPYLDFK